MIASIIEYIQRKITTFKLSNNVYIYSTIVSLVITGSLFYILDKYTSNKNRIKINNLVGIAQLNLIAPQFMSQQILDIANFYVVNYGIQISTIFYDDITQSDILSYFEEAPVASVSTVLIYPEQTISSANILNQIDKKTIKNITTIPIVALSTIDSKDKLYNIKQVDNIADFVHTMYVKNPLYRPRIIANQEFILPHIAAIYSTESKEICEYILASSRRSLLSNINAYQLYKSDQIVILEPYSSLYDNDDDGMPSVEKILLASKGAIISYNADTPIEDAKNNIKTACLKCIAKHADILLNMTSVGNNPVSQIFFTVDNDEVHKDAKILLYDKDLRINLKIGCRNKDSLCLHFSDFLINNEKVSSVFKERENVFLRSYNAS